MAKRPNIIIIVTDQQRADLTKREGYELDPIPFIDELADDGAWFNHAYTPAPVCSPARTSLLTGRFPSAHRVTQNAAQDSAVFAADLFSVAREHGYSTSLIGKNHTYLKPEQLDELVEFSHGGQISGTRSHTEAEFDKWLTGLSHRTAVAASPGGIELQNPYRIVSHAIDWIESVDSDRPFLMQMSFPEPHNPYQVCDQYFDMFPPEAIPAPTVGQEFLDTAPYPWRYLLKLGERGQEGYAQKIPRARSNYLGMLRLIDDQVKRLVRFLDESGTRENTLLIITSDHGDYFGEYGLVRKGAGVPEVLMRIPFVISGPMVVRGQGPRTEFVSLTDIFPTLCELMGAPLPHGVQGRSLLPLFRNERIAGREFDSIYGEQGIGGIPLTSSQVSKPWPGLPDGSVRGAPCFDELNSVTQSGRMRMVRQGKWKLIIGTTGQMSLHDLDEDPFELTNLVGRNESRETIVELLTTLARWAIRVEDELPLPNGGYTRGSDERNYRWT